jgi:hypothetical protein
MPCYFFTYHGHGTWMPDHKRGYVRRGMGVQPSDANLASRYRQHQHLPPVNFTPDMQQVVVETLIQAGRFVDAVIHAVAMEPTHVHVQVSWKHGRTWKSMRASLRNAVTQALNRHCGKRDWFADQPSRKRIRDLEHFDYLLLVYVPKHRGVVWQRPKSLHDAHARDSRRQVSVFDRRKRRKPQ